MPLSYRSGTEGAQISLAREINNMKSILLIFLLSLPCWASHKIDVEVLNADQSTQSYDVPARAACIPGTNGPTCVARGEETYSVGFVHMDARINGVNVVLSCNSAHEKQCSRFQPGVHPAEAKGKDEIILYGWRNPMYRGDFSKAMKVKFKIGAK